MFGKKRDDIVVTDVNMPKGLVKVTNLTTKEAVVTEERADKVRKAILGLRNK